MKYILSLASIFFILFSCEEPRSMSSVDPINWKKRTVQSIMTDSLDSGSTFLSVYSQIYMHNEENLSDLTVTVSLHNPNLTDSLFVDKAVYYDTHGKSIRTYFDQTIFIKPMETVQIIIDGIDSEGGTGANFVFDWKKKPAVIEPIFEAVMINTYGQQGISFMTQGKRIK